MLTLPHPLPQPALGRVSLLFLHSAHAAVTSLITFLHFTGYIILNLQVLIPVWSWWWSVVVRTLSWSVVCGRPSRRVIKVLDVFDSAGWTGGQRLDARRTCDGTCATVERGRRVARSRDAEGG